MTAERKRAPVAIVGGGPVGAALAIDLAQRGVQCVVLERRDEPQRVPKGQNLTQRTMEHMRRWGVEDEVRAARTVPAAFGIGGVTAYRSLFGSYAYDWLQREIVRPFYATDNERLPQYATEHVLRARLHRLPAAQLLTGFTVDALEQDDDAARLTAEDRYGQRLEVTADFVVGCDGSRSIVRSSTRISETRTDHDRRMALIVFRSEGLHELVERYPGKSFFNVLDPALDGYWKFLGRVDLAERTWFFHAPTDDAAPVTASNAADYVQGSLGARFDVEILHLGSWDLRFAQADSYRDGRVFVAGDAAHSHPPYGGYGINTGFEDAANLAWKLQGALEGWGSEVLLDSYDLERRPVFASTRDSFIARSIETDRLFLSAFDPETDPAGFEAEWARRAGGSSAEVDAYEPHYGGSPVVVGSSDDTSAVGRHELRARPGHHLAPLPGEVSPLFDRLGSGFTIIDATDAGDGSTGFHDAAVALDVPLSSIRLPPGHALPPGEELILVRPDQFVAWTGGADADPSAVLRASIGR